MRIPNKFNGYSRDGIRLYNDPVTAAAIAAGGTSTATMAGTALLGTGAAAATAAAPLLQGIAAGTTLAGYGSNLAAASLASAPAVAAPAVIPASGVASGFDAAKYLANSGLGNALPSASQTAIQQAATGAPANFQALGQAQADILSKIAPNATQTANAVPVTPTFQPPTPIVENTFLNPTISAPGTSPAVQLATPKPANTPGFNPYDALSNLPKSESDAIAQANKAIENNGMTGNVLSDLETLIRKPNFTNLKAFANENPYTTAAGAYGLYKLMQPKPIKERNEPQYQRPYSNTTRINPNVDYYRPYSGGSTAERTYFTGGLEAQPIYRVAEGGLMSLAAGGTVETMSAANAVGQNMDYPQAGLQTSLYSNPMMQRPVSTDVIKQGVDTNVDPYTGEERMAAGGMASGGEAGGYKYDYNPKTMQFTQLNDPVADAAQKTANDAIMYGSVAFPRSQTTAALTPFTPVVTGGIATPTGQVDQVAPMQQAQPMQEQPYPAYQTPEQQLGLNGFYDYMNQQLGGMGGYKGFAGGGMASLGGYSDGGRLLRGPGDGVSDSIPASIGNRQPARLADGEFVIPARIVSEIGNGSTEAGARKLYAMMDRVQKARKKSTGKNKVAVNSKAERLLPA